MQAADLGLSGSELPDAIEADAGLLARLEAVRGAAALRLGLSPSVEEAIACSPQSPLIAIVSAPQPATTLAGEAVAPEAVDLTARVMSMGQAHRALPLTPSSSNSPSTAALAPSSGKRATIRFPVFTLWSRTAASPFESTEGVTRPSSTAKGPTAEVRLPQFVR